MDVFGGAPRFLAYPRPVIVQSGTDAALKCQIAGDPRPAVIWERNNERIHPEGRYRLFEDGNVYNLIISGVTSEDSGQYICKAKNSIGETYAAATLKVEGEAQEKELREENRPRFLIKPLSTRVGRGEDAVFSCKLWGKPLPEVVWEKDGKRLNEIFESTHFSVSYQDGGWFQLKIFKTRAPDGGVYTCKAKNEFGEGLAGAVLLVDAGPGHEEEATRNGYANGHWKAHPGKARGGRQVATRPREEPLPHSAKVKMFAVTEGKHAKFRCYVTGKPKPEIIWRKDGRVILSGRRYLLYEDREGYFTLKVLYCKQQDNGVYVCAASNTAGQTLSAVHLTVKEPLVRFKQPLSDLEVFERELAILECEVPEDSIPITWYLEDRRLHPGAKYGMEEWGTKRRLTIRDIGADDDGIYLCEMADGGRSIAEVAVKGTIVRKLPRKVDVLEGENAAFCVEVEEEEMEIHWYKDGVELRETHQTIIKSFGKTHILVFVNASPQDSGKVTFIVGRSKTSSQLRVKAVRHSSPSCPVGVQINTERANAALLSWAPAPDSRRNPPSGYVLERQEVGSQEWLQCLTTDSATAVEILGDSVPCEADYRFRICSVNKYGRSSHVEFPRAAHLVPVAKIQTPLQDALVPEGQDASFTIELSASVMGTWFLNGGQLQEDERFAVRRSRTHHSLRVRGVRDADNGAEITFIACGVRDSAALYIQAPLVKFTPLSEMDRNKFVEVGNPIVLYCELSDPTAPVHWYKNGVELHTVEGLNIQSEGNMRRIVIQSAEFSHSGVYSCDAIDDVIRFNVEVEAPPVRFSALPEVAKSKSFEPGSPILLHCEISDPTAQVSWYKDGVQLHPQSGVEIQSEGTTRTLAVPSADILHSGVYSCKTKGDAIKFNVDIKAPPVKFCSIPEDERCKSVEAGHPVVLNCQLSDPSAQVSWYKDGAELFPKAGTDLRSAGIRRTLVVESAQLSDSGVYCCSTADDAVQFNVKVKAPPVRFLNLPEDERNMSVEAGRPIVLRCEISEPTGQVSWYKDEEQLLPKTGVDIQSEGKARTLTIQSAELSHAGVYSCKTASEAIQFHVEVKEQFHSRPFSCEISDDTVQTSMDVKAASVDVSAEPEAKKIKYTEEAPPPAPLCEVIKPTAKDEIKPLQQTGRCIQSEGTMERVTDQSAQPPHLTQLIKISSETGRYVQSEDTMERDTDQSAQLPYLTQLIKNSSETGQYVQSEDTMEKETDQSAQLPALTHLKTNYSQTGRYIQSQGTMVRETDQSAQLPHLTHLRTNYSQTGQYIQSESTMERVTDQSAQPLPLTHLIKKSSETGRYVQSEDTMERDTDQSAQLPYLTQLIKNSSETGQYVQSEDTMERETTQSTQPPHLTHLRSNNSQSDRYIQSEDTMERETDQSARLPHLTHLRSNNSQSDRYIQSEDTVERETVQSTQPPHLTHLRSNNSQSDRYIQSEDTVERETDQSAQPLHLTQLRKNNNDPGQHIQSEGTVERVTDQSAQPPHLTHLRMNYSQTGRYIQSEDTVERETDQSARLPHLTQLKKNSSDAEEDATAFKVDVEAHPEDEKSNFVDTDWPTVQQCEISDPTSESKWSKDGQNLLPQNGTDIQSEGTTRGLTVQSAKLSHSRLNSCETMEDARQFHVDVKAPPAHFKELAEDDRSRSVEAGCPIVLQCEISDSNAQVSWAKDGVQLHPQSGVDIQSEGQMRKLVIQSAERSHSGVYSCGFAEEVVTFKVDVQDLPVKFSEIPEVAKSRSVEAGCPIVLHCEISDPTAQVTWYKDGVLLHPQSGVEIQSEDKTRTLTIQSAELCHSGTYRCETADDTMSFKVDVKAPPVTFLDEPEENLHKSIVELDPLVLSCQVSRPNASVVWYKDGAEVQPSSNVTIQADGTMRRLILRSAQLSDAGTYTCRAGDNALIFKVNIREPPVMIVYPKEDVHLDRHVSEEVVLSCELSRSNGTVHWYKDGQKLQESQSIKLKSEGPYRRLKILNCGIEDSGEYVCDTADDSIFFQLNITEPPVSIVSPSQSQMELCQQTSERVVLSCEISRPNATVRWYRDGLEVEESNTLILEVDGVYRRLIIPETTVQDSAEYVCDTGDDSVTFFVNIAEPPVRFVRPRKMPSAVEILVGNPLVLECEVSRSSAEVSWKKDGEEMEDSRNVTIIEDGIFRQLTVHVSKFEHSGQYVCDAKDDVMDFHVKVTEPPVKILKKCELKTEQLHLEWDDIVLECELSRANGAVRWSKDGQSVEENEHFCIEEEGAFRSLVILNAELSDTGEYACHSTDDSVVFNVQVKERPVAIVGNSESPEKHSLLAGDDLILACEVSRSNAPVEWYCNGRLLSPDARTHIDSYGTVRKLVLTGLRPSDSGEYTCDAVDDKMTTLVKVQEAPAKFLNKEKANLVTGYESESVTLSATTSRDSATVRWLKDWTQVSGERFHVRQEGNRHFLTIDPLHRSDSGGYTCDTTGDEVHFSLLVKEMRVKFVRALEDAVAHADGMVTLRCQLCRAKGDVLWLKDGEEIAPSRRLAIRADGPERSLTIHRLTPQDAGQYACESKDDRTSATLRVETPRVVEFIAELNSTTVMEGEDATFKCVVSPEDVQLIWQMDGERIYPSEKFRMSSNGLCHVLLIRHCQVTDSSKITAEAEGVLSRAKLQVQEAQVLFTKKMAAVEAEEFGEATLEVEVTPESGEVHWIRQNVVIQPGPKFTLKQNGPKRSLTVHNLSLSDRGMYRCETLHDRTQGKISVEPRKISVRRGLTPIDTFERETATFEVELSHDNVEGVWQKDGVRLKPSSRWRPSAKGRLHSLTLSGLTLEDSGTVAFTAETARTSARLTVREPPVSILKKLEDQCSPEGSAVSLECELSRQNVDVKWLKNGSEVKGSKTQRIYSMGRKRFFQLMKCELSDSGVYVCDAGDISTSCSLEVYEQEVEIVQGLEDLDIKEDQNAVFMCEVSLPDIAGEWFRNGEKIRPTSTVKIRQEGAKHFLLICNVRVEDAGEIKFVAKQVESTASLEVEEMPVSIVKPLRDKTALEGHRVVLECAVSNPRCSIRWYQGSKVILPSERFEICSEGCHRKLLIQQVELEDEGTYSVQAGEHTTSARLTVEAQLLQMVRELTDVTVAAPDEARFECEVSVPVSKAPMWSLKEQTLHPGPTVRLEARGTVHRLTLKNTSADMSGVVRFSCAKAKSSARLTVTDN